MQALCANSGNDAPMRLSFRALSAAVAGVLLASSLAVAGSATSPVAQGPDETGHSADVRVPWAALAGDGHDHAGHGDDVVVNPDVPALARAEAVEDTEAEQSDGLPGAKSGSARYTDRTPRPVSTYDVHVVAASTPHGGHGTTRESARRMIERLDAEYNRETQGHYRFRLASFRTTTSPIASCDIDWWAGRHRRVPGPSAGATDSTWVVVADAPCNYAGVAYMNGAGIHILPEYFVPAAAVTDPGAEGGELDVLVLAHEIGHNLGLAHAMSQSAHAGVAFPGPTSAVYGSHFSSMGGLRSTFRLGASELIDLGVTPADEMVFATQPSTTVTLAPMTATTGPRTLVVPLRDTHHAVLSYRNGTGQDWPLKYGVPLNRDGSAGSDLGVHVESEPFAVSMRLFSPDRDVNSLATATPAGNGADERQRQAFKAGETIALSAGVKVTVVSVTAAGATVTVTRPADSGTPVLNPFDSFNACSNITSVQARRPGTLKRSGSTCSTLGTSARLSFDLNRTVDDTWVARTGVDVNGRTVTSRTWPMSRRRSGQGTRDFDGGRFSRSVTLGQGTSTVTVWVEDAFGKRTSRTSTVTLKKDLRTSAVRSLKAKTAKRTSVKLTWKKPTTRGTTVTDYVVKVSRFKDGRWTSPKTYKDKKSSRTGATVKNLKPGTRYKFTVVAKNKHGLSAVRAAKARTRR